MYDINSLYVAKNVSEAREALLKNDKAKIIAGGTDVLIGVREGKLAGVDLVSINGISELSGVSLTDSGSIRIGALTTFTEIEKNDIINKYVPVLANAVSQVGGPQIRNTGTIGGNISNGVTSADSGATLLALNAQVEIYCGDTTKVVSLAEFYISAGKVALLQGDIVTAVIIEKADYDGYSGHYIKYAMRNAMDIATIACSVAVKYDNLENTATDLRIAFGTAAPVPIRCKATEETIRGGEFSDGLLEKLCTSVRGEINPRSSWRASKEFRLQIAGEIAKRALTEAIKKAGEV